MTGYLYYENFDVLIYYSFYLKNGLHGLYGLFHMDFMDFMDFLRLGALIFRLFLLAFNSFQQFCWVFFFLIARVFSCHKIREKGSPLILTSKELNFADMADFAVFRDI